MNRWLTFGLSWGIFMFVCMGILWPLYNHQQLTAFSLIINAICYGAASVAVTYWIKYVTERSRSAKNA
jgi:hypothetical protein